jgi:phage shock protein C
MRSRIENKRPGLYRSRRGIIFGVCQGIADYMDISVFWTRVIVLAFLVFTGIWPIVGLYVLAALLMKPEPVLPLHTEEDHEFYNSYLASGSMAVRRLKRSFDNLNRRIQRLEDLVTTREYDWERRLNEKA